MKVVFLCTLNFILISIASSQSDITLGHVCEYAGVTTWLALDIPFSPTDIPKRCELVTYGMYYFDATSVNDGNMFKRDEDAILALANVGMPVYTYVGFEDVNASWCPILDPDDPARYDQLVRPLIQKVKDTQVTGIILNINQLYNKEIPDIAHKICEFVCKIKIEVPNLKFGLFVDLNGYEAYKHVKNNEIFDFTVTNSHIDLYFIDLETHNYKCSPEFSKSGTLISSPDPNALTLELFGTIISESTMDKRKTIASIIIMPLTDSHFGTYIPYSQYCNELPDSNSTTYCVDSIQKLYDIGVCTKKYFAGIAVDWIEFDDLNNRCECPQPYPVTNTLFDGWDGSSLQPCPKLDRT